MKQGSFPWLLLEAGLSICSFGFFYFFEKEVVKKEGCHQCQITSILKSLSSKNPLGI